MQVKDSRFHKVFKVDPKANITLLNLGDSRKKPDNTWDNFFWSGMCVGEAHKQAADLNEGDTITIKEGMAYLETFNNKIYGKVTIFSLEITKRAEPKVDMPSQQAPVPQYESIGDEPF